MSEIEETKQLLSQATFPGLRDVLSKYLRSLESIPAKAEIASTNEIPDDTKIDFDATETIEAKPSNSTGVKYTPPSNAQFIPLQEFSWDQGEYNSPTVTIYVDLQGVGKVKQNCNCNFTKSSFDLTVMDLDGKNYRMLKDNLDKEIVPEKSKMIIKANKVILKLEKVKGEYSYETWTNLIAKKRRTEEVKKKDDPTASIMDMMKDLYEDGDENMKKIIGEAMYKSQRGEKYSPDLADSIHSK
jgi:calcyclin binding protein